MTKVGDFLRARSANLSEISRKTGISKSRLNQLVNNPSAHLRATELFLIFKAVGALPGDEFMTMYQDLKLQDQSKLSQKKGEMPSNKPPLE